MFVPNNNRSHDATFMYACDTMGGRSAPGMTHESEEFEANDHLVRISQTAQTYSHYYLHPYQINNQGTD